MADSITVVGIGPAIIANDWSNRDAWQAGVTLDYKITEGLSTKIAVNYYDEDDLDNEQWNGFVRLQRSF
ncbi:putative outer membrane protein y4fJ precursor [compost metagenome]